MRPQRETGYDRGSAMLREFRESRSGAGFLSEEIYEYPLIEGGVLIDENADGAACFKGLQYASRSVLFLDDMVAGKRPIAFNEDIEARIVERAHDDMHRSRHPGVGESTELPVAEMRGGDQDSAAPG